MEYKYRGQTQDGSQAQGTLNAQTRIDATDQLRSRGIIPLSIIEVEKKSGDILAPIMKLIAHVSLQEKITFTKNLSGMIKAGLSLGRALSVLERQSTNQLFKDTLTGIMRSVNSGKPLSQALKAYPKTFSTLFVAMVRAGEESGKLVETLKEIGIQLEKSYTLRKRIKGAMIYPSIIVCVVVIIGILMFIFVIPTLVQIFKDMELELPLPTRIIIWISDAISSNPLGFVLGLAILVALIFYILRLPKLKRPIDAFILKFPVVKKIARQSSTAQTARTLSSLISSGVQIGQALEITRDVIQNSYYKDVLEEARNKVQNGISLSSVFQSHTEIYPIMFGEMIEVGEETGQLSQMLLDVAEFYESEVDEQTKNLSTIIEPILMVFIGGAVGFFAVSMIQPMYSLVSGLQ